MRLIDKIWDQLLSDSGYENENLTYIELPKNSFEALSREFSQEFQIDDPSIEDIEEYFALKITVKESDESFRLL